MFNASELSTAVKYAESFGAVVLRAEDPLDLAALLPETLARQAPVIIDVPVRNLELPRAKFLTPLPKVPWDATTRRHNSLLTPNQLHQWANPLFDGGPSSWRPWLPSTKLHSASA